jgi:hypothetical protein
VGEDWLRFSILSPLNSILYYALSLGSRLFIPFLFFLSVVSRNHGCFSCGSLLFCRSVLFGGLVMHMEQGSQSLSHPRFPSLWFFLLDVALTTLSVH